jgi:curli biogenesis system outer membrane secretion channel CsgG
MIGFGLQPRFCAPLVLLAAFTATVSAALAQDTPSGVPVCDKKIATVAVADPEQKWWLQLNLENPEALLKAFADESKCFTLVDRGRGLAAAQQERALASGNQLAGGSNMGDHQIVTADYILLPDIANKNAKSGGSRFGGLVGGMLGHGAAGALLSGLSLDSKTADVVLTLTDVRSTEQVALVKGHAKKTDVGFGAVGGGFNVTSLVAAGASTYANTDIGQVVAMAYLDAFTKLVEQLKQNPLAPRATIGTDAARADAAGTLTNAGVIQMVQSKLSDAIVIDKIRSSKRGFDMSTDGLIALSKAGVSEPVIKAMLER